MKGQMAGGHLLINGNKLIIVICARLWAMLGGGGMLAVLHQKIKPELLCVCTVVVAVICLRNGRINVHRKMAGGGIVDIIIADMINTRIIILNFWWTATRRLLRRASREP